MENPMMQYLNRQTPSKTNTQAAVEQAKRIMSGGNNQMLSSVLSLCKGRNPKDVFYSKCKEMGVNPEDILSLIR